MTSLRRLAVLLTSGLIALGSAAPALAQSAGDEQYSDPLAGQGASKPSKPAKSSGSGNSAPSLTQQPQGSGSAGSSSSGSGSSGTPAPVTAAPSTASPTQAAPAASSAGQLPRTGLDTGAIAALGVALMLLGIGLRLRTADARF